MSNSAISTVQTVQTVLLANATINPTATVFSDLTDGTTTMAVTITPASASNKILLLGSLVATANTTTNVFTFKIYNGTSYLMEATSAGSRTPGGYSLGGGTVDDVRTIPICYLDAPNTTSAVTYTIRSTGSAIASVSYVINQSRTDTNSASFMRYFSTLTAIEVKA